MAQAIGDHLAAIEERIRNLVPPGGITPRTRLILTNAIYFKAAWAEPFDRADTSEGSFHLLDGRQVLVPMMRQIATFGHTSGPDYQAVELPYKGHELSMVILVPDAGRFVEVEAVLDGETIDVALEGLERREIDLMMPSFSFDWDIRLKAVLSEMGMPIAFDSGNADFLGMVRSPVEETLYVEDVVHKAFVAVDEEGTEAAAATAVIVPASPSLPPEPRVLMIDRPFVFLIRDIETGVILFVGRVVDPSPKTS